MRLLDYLKQRLADQGITRKGMISTLVLTVVMLLFLHIFYLNGKTQIDTADVSPDGSLIAFASMDEQRLWCYSEDGALCFVHDFTAEETAGGDMAVFCSNEYVRVFTFRDDLLLTFDLSGNRLSCEPTSDRTYTEAEQFRGWEHHTGRLILERNGRTYECYRSYWMVRFCGRARYVSVTRPGAGRKILWSTTGKIA